MRHPLLAYLNEPAPVFRGHKIPDEVFRPLTYLACPYTHPDSEVREQRFVEATKAAAWLMNIYNWNIFSPITHSAPMHTIAGVQGDWAFWKKIDTEFLNVSCRLIVLGLDGWRQSTGVQAEIVIAKEMGIPIYFLGRNDNPDSLYTLHLENSHHFFDNP